MQGWRVALSAKSVSLSLLLLCVFASPHPSFAQSADQLLQQTAKHYQLLTGYEMRGHANAAIPGSVWQLSGSFTIVGPRQEPSPAGPPKTTPGRIEAGVKPIKTVLDSPEQRPASASLPLALLTGFGAKIADAVVAVERSGSETLRSDEQDVLCEILKVTYTPTTYERPHPEAVTYWISPEKHLVLKEVLTFNAGRQIDHALWTITVDSLAFDRPIPKWALIEIPDLKERSEWIGRSAPAFTLPASDGAPVTLSSLRGKEVLLDFWSITCGPCKLEMPMIEEIGHDYEGRAVVLLGISVDPTEKSKAWLDRNSRTLRTLTDADFSVSDAYKVQGLPALVLIGRDGVVTHYWEGMVPKTTIQSALQASRKP